MKINIFLLLVILGVVALWTSYSATRSPQSDSSPKEEDTSHLMPAPDFTYSTVQGKTGNLRDHKGKTLLLHFWASWCGPCLIEFPDLVELARKKPENFVILAVSTDKNLADINKFLANLDKTIPENFIVIQDGDKKISQDLYQTVKLPETYLINPDQKITEKRIGPQENWLSLVDNNNETIE